MRGSYQGVANIVRFNWHFYAIAAAAAIVVALAIPHLPSALQWICLGGLAAGIGTTVMSLAVSHYVYDRSHLYDLTWTSTIPDQGSATVITINAGFDEISEILRERIPGAQFLIWDFYDEKKHTEISIKRARTAYPPPAGTVAVKTDQLPMRDGCADLLVLFMSAHEIRNPEERLDFLRECNRILKPDARLIITEHLRDLPNFLAYTIGFFHFYSRSTWLNAIECAGFSSIEERKETPFVSTFICKKSTT